MRLLRKQAVGGQNFVWNISISNHGSRCASQFQHESKQMFGMPIKPGGEVEQILEAAHTHIACSEGKAEHLRTCIVTSGAKRFV